MKNARLLEEADRLRSQNMLTSLGAGSSSIMCACDFIAGLWGGALSRRLCGCSHVEGTCLETHSEMHPEPLNLNKYLRPLVPCMGEYINFQNLHLLSLSCLYLCLSLSGELCRGQLGHCAAGNANPEAIGRNNISGASTF